MPEKDVIGRTAEPFTIASLTDRLRGCGGEPRQTVLTHLAMSNTLWWYS